MDVWEIGKLENPVGHFHHACFSRPSGLKREARVLVQADHWHRRDGKLLKANSFTTFIDSMALSFDLKHSFHALSHTIHNIFNITSSQDGRWRSLPFLLKNVIAFNCQYLTS